MRANPRQVARVCAATLLVSVVTATPAAAHFGGLGSAEARFAIPEWIVWVTGGLVVTFSFIALGAYALWKTAPGTGLSPPAREPLDPPRGVPRAVARAAGVAALALVVANGLFASRGPWPDTVVWLGTWSLLPLVAYTLGNPWPWLSPFRALAPWADRARGGRAPVPYPLSWGSWPAVALLLAVFALEVTPLQLRGPGWLGLVALAYTAFTIAGMAAFGSATWLSQVEVFDRVFERWAAAAPFTRIGGRWRLRGFSAGLRDIPARGMADAAFVVALLFGVNYDGFLGTPAGAWALRGLAPVGADVARGILLLAGFAAFLAAFALCAFYVRRASESLEPFPQLAARVAPALLPIAVGYHVAHNIFYVTAQAPRFLAALDDPLGSGSLFGFGQVGVLAFPPAWVWVVGAAQLGFILLGHVVAVVVAHVRAFEGFPSRVQAVRSEGPLTLAMVLYTLVGLWIVASSTGAGPAVTPAVGVLAFAAAVLSSQAHVERGLACRRCGERYARPAYLALHLGRAHADAQTDAERQSFAAAVAEEEAWLAGFQRHMRGGLATLPCVIFLLVSAFLLDALGVSPALMILIVPGMAAFAALLYYFAWSAKP